MGGQLKLAAPGGNFPSIPKSSDGLPHAGLKASEMDVIMTEGIQQKSRVLVDFSSPNIAKNMHVGHLRSTI